MIVNYSEKRNKWGASLPGLPKSIYYLNVHMSFFFTDAIKSLHAKWWRQQRNPSILQHAQHRSGGRILSQGLLIYWQKRAVNGICKNLIKGWWNNIVCNVLCTVCNVRSNLQSLETHLTRLNFAMIEHYCGLLEVGFTKLNRKLS